MSSSRNGIRAQGTAREGRRVTLFAIESTEEWPPGVQPPEGLPTTPNEAVVDVADRTDRTCALEGCMRRVFSREWCQMHYVRWWRHGDPNVTHSTRDIPVLERIAPLIDKAAPGGCWLWTGPLNESGYAMRRQNSGSSSLVHRWLYQLLVGPVDRSLHLDHLCHTRDESCRADRSCPHRRCVNPAHLEPVTPAENNRRSRSPAQLAAKANRCKRGHDLTVHGYVRKDKKGRNCKACGKITGQIWRDRLRAQGISPYKPRRKRDAA